MTAPATETAIARTIEAPRFTVVYEGAIEHSEARILSGDTPPGRAVTVTVGDAVAERDDARAAWGDLNAALTSSITIATARIAELEAQIERLSFTDEKGAVWRPVPAWTYFDLCQKRDALAAEIERLAALLRPIQRCAGLALRPEADIGDGEIGEVYQGGKRLWLHTRDLRAIRDAVLPDAPARAALNPSEARHDQP